MLPPYTPEVESSMIPSGRSEFRIEIVVSCAAVGAVQEREQAGIHDLLQAMVTG